MDSVFTDDPVGSIPLIALAAEDLGRLLASRPARWRNWVGACGFEGGEGEVLGVPASDGGTEAVLVGFDARQPMWMLAAAFPKLRPGVYRLESVTLGSEDLLRAMVGWGLAAYRFDRYRKSDRVLPRLVWPDEADAARVRALVNAHALGRDLINTPAADLMPDDLARAACEIGTEFGAQVTLIGDDERIRREYPCMHAVGAGSAFASRVVELAWGSPEAPHVVIAGKGVCFDSGGLNLKTGSHMRLMKKDMGGAAVALALARLVMSLRLPLRITTLIGAVENAVGPRSFRPGDVLKARNGRMIEIDNTDAEGRLVLADLLVRAGELNPDLLIDFATLTGAARVAVGTEIAAFFSNDDALAGALTDPAATWDDPVWRLPLHRPYRHLLDSDVADGANCSSGGYAGAITAALFLQEFVPDQVPWLHFDLMAWNLRERPGRPKGGEVMALRAVLGLLESRYTQRR